MPATQLIHDDYFDETPDYSPRRLEFSLPHLRSLRDDARIVDVGCGTGTALVWVADNTELRDFTGIDPSARSLEVASERVSMTSVQGSALDPDLLAEHAHSYDAAVMAAVLHHVVSPTRSESYDNARRTLASAALLLRPGGKLFLFEPCYGPRAVLFTIFWIKRLAMRLGVKSRPLPGPDWINPGPPLVSYLGAGQLDALVGESFVVEERHELSSKRLGGLIRKQGMGYVLTPR